VLQPPVLSMTVPTPPGAQVRQVDPVADLAAFRTVLFDGFFEGDEGGRSFIEATFASPSSLALPGLGVFLAELDGRPAAVAGAWPVGADAGIGWVATVPWARRRGLGALVTARSVEYAFDQGAELVVLQASPSGRPVYERLGFTAVGLHRLWEPPID
jgi:ribosomal protein S18 acetylase RimI-like enzyme